MLRRLWFPSLQSGGPIEAHTERPSRRQDPAFPSLQSGGPIEAHSVGSIMLPHIQCFRRCKAAAPLKPSLADCVEGAGGEFPSLQSGGPIEARTLTHSLTLDSLFPSLQSGGPIEAPSSAMNSYVGILFPSLQSGGPIEASLDQTSATAEVPFPSLQSGGPIEAVTTFRFCCRNSMVSVAAKRRPH